MLDVVMHTIGVVSILWAVLSVLALGQLYDSVEVKYFKAKVTIKPIFFTPFIGVIFYIVWLVVL